MPVPAAPPTALVFGSSRQPGSSAETVFTNKEAFYLTPLSGLVIHEQHDGPGGPAGWE
ncbi:hypothetical protein GCM10022408_02990 [Hymenobacter fastidiosus]|uniref:Uncharacterized protein n=1 Tax=Hymenobacter fastidiosus TaxID=486264 RepID=A0ABP7RD98_9BACT